MKNTKHVWKFQKLNFPKKNPETQNKNRQLTTNEKN